MIPALSQVCSLNSPFEKDLEDYAAGQCRAIEVWLGKLETYLEAHTVDEVCQLCQRYGVTLPVAAFQGGLLASQGDARSQHWQHFEQRLALCQQLAIGTLVLAGDLHGAISQQDIERVQLSLQQAADLATRHNVRLALEFRSGATLGNNLQTAAALVSQAGRPNLGLCFDVFHYYTGPSKFEDLGYLSPANLFHVQLCDLSASARELVTDSDRILPGDGEFQLEPIIDVLRQINYVGHISIEVMNPQIWQVPARQFGEVAMTALRKLLGQASMG